MQNIEDLDLVTNLKEVMEMTTVVPEGYESYDKELLETVASDAKKLSGYKYHSGSLDANRTEMSSAIRTMAKKDPELQRDIDRLNHMSPYDRDHKPNKEYNATAIRIGKKVCGAHFNKRAFQEVAVNEKRVVTGRR